MYSEGLNARSPHTNILPLSGEKVGELVEVGGMVLSGIEWERVGMEGNNEPVRDAPDGGNAEVADGKAAEIVWNERAMLGDIKKAVAAASVILESLKGVENVAKGVDTP